MMTVDDFLEEYKRLARPRLEKEIEDWRKVLDKVEREYKELYGVSYDEHISHNH